MKLNDEKRAKDQAKEGKLLELTMRLAKSKSAVREESHEQEKEAERLRAAKKALYWGLCLVYIRVILGLY